MPANAAEPLTLHYVLWKSFLFGSLPIALGGLMIWVGIEALDPDWTAQVTKGQYLVDAPPWVRGPVILASAAILVAPGLRLVWAGLTRAPVVTIDQSMIAARTIFSRRRQLPWARIVEAKRKNQLILSPAGTNTLSQEIWDLKSVVLDTGMLDVGGRDIEALVLHHRPGLVFRDVK